jgi:signal transduction histidine kinase
VQYGRRAGAIAALVLSGCDFLLRNVRRHCGEQARAWVLVEDEPGLVTVTVRDDGPGIRDGRLAEAAAAGRLGVSHSICGRLRDLGGSATIRSVPGEGTEVTQGLRAAHRAVRVLVLSASGRSRGRQIHDHGQFRSLSGRYCPRS